MKRGQIKIGSFTKEGVVSFIVEKQVEGSRRPIRVQQEVTCTGDLRADIAKAARWQFGAGGRLVKGRDYLELPSTSLAAYGITRETKPSGKVSVLAPVFDVWF